MPKRSFLDDASMKIDKYVAKYGVASKRAGLRFGVWAALRGFGFPEFLGLTWRGGANRRRKTVDDDLCRVKIEVFGGLGDLIIALNYIRAFDAAFVGRRQIVVYSHRDKSLGAIQNLCREQEFNVEVVSTREAARVQNCDVELEIVRFPKLVFCNRRKLERLEPRIAEICAFYRTFFENNSIYFRTGSPAYFLGREFSLLNGQNRMTQADLGGFLNVGVDFRPKIFGDVAATKAKFGLDDGPYITLQRGAGNDRPNEATKLWPLEKYVELVAALRRKYPGVKIVQLGSPATWAIEGVDVDLRGKTDFEELKVLLKDAVCHFDGECGLVHLRRFLGGGPSVVVFGPTSEEFFAYPENVNLGASACPGGCEWLTATYVERCPRGCDRCERLAAISVEDALRGVAEAVDEQI
ncbi:MAG: hypothetical protein IJ387_13610 [Thermoguttaceae bacterium]|nr:hypothetical protein [Thermoguttaceae bacterium]